MSNPKSKDGVLSVEGREGNGRVHSGTLFRGKDFVGTPGDLKFFVVGSEESAVITAPNGNRMVIDCGSNLERGWWPSVQFMYQPTELLVISNLDGDHASDAEGMMKRSRLVFTNPTVGARELALLKAEHGMPNGVAAIHSALSDPRRHVPLQTDLGELQVQFFWNRYGEFTDSNNLSVVTFVRYHDFSIVFPGDIEGSGWEMLLRDVNFRAHLSRVTVFVASHHGRANGCSKKAFSGPLGAKPELIVMSDRDKQFDSQETVPWYRQRASGKAVRNFLDTRHVLTTRADGDITITVQPPQPLLFIGSEILGDFTPWRVETSRGRSAPLEPLFQLLGDNPFSRGLHPPTS